jgi:hypothetical protein
VLGGRQIGRIETPRAGGPQASSLGQGLEAAVEQRRQVSQRPLHQVVGQGLRTDGPFRAGPRALGRPPLATPVLDVGRMAADQPPAGCIAEPQRWPGLHALSTTPRLHAVEQALLHTREHCPLKCRAPDLSQPLPHAPLLQKGAELSPPSPFIQTLDPVDALLSRQASCDPRVIAARGLPTQPFRQVLRDHCSYLPPRPPPSRACLAALEERGPQIQTGASIGTSVTSAE